MPRRRQQIAPLSDAVEQLEALPQPVVAYGRDLRAGEVLPSHRHRRAQLVYARTGVMVVTTPTASYLVPPERAVWMPGSVEHRIEARGDVAMRTLYVEPWAVATLPVEVCVLQVTPLLRELIVAAVAAGPEYAPDTPLARLMQVLLDQIASQPVAALALPMPTEPRLLRVVRTLIEDPADDRTLSDWALEVGASKRTLTRLFAEQTGMSFRDWRQQRRLHRALELLGAGDNVTRVAADLGYDSTSAFIAMFKRTLGVTPARYLEQRRARG